MNQRKKIMEAHMKNTLKSMLLGLLCVAVTGCAGEAAFEQANIVEEDGTRPETEVMEQLVVDNPVDTPVDNPVVTPTGPEIEFVTVDELDEATLQEVTLLRTAINYGLDLGRDHYLERVSIILDEADIIHDLESTMLEGLAIMDETPHSCPFAEYYNGGDNFTPTTDACEFLVNKAKVESYAKLGNALDMNPLTMGDLPDNLTDDAAFWYEQGITSGIEEHKVLVRSNLIAYGMCNHTPSVRESSAEKGVIVGRQLFVEQFNEWLVANGYVGDYPTMSQKIEVCNIDDSLLDPALQNAREATAAAMTSEPLCEDYEPTDLLGKQQYAQAELDYEDAIEQGVEDEYSVAAVTVFEVVPCNVSDPLVIDLDQDGIELLPIHKGVNFDMYSVDRPQAVAWIHPDDAFLVYDRNENGSIDNGSELFGNVNHGYKDGFAQLATLDTNRDGMINAVDADFAKLQLWRDIDSDGVSTSGELLKLSDAGIISIPLQAEESNILIEGSRISVMGEMHTTNGAMLIGDAFLRTAPHPRMIR
jgi:hypothetical protein